MYYKWANFNSNSKWYHYNDSEGGVGEKVLGRSHNWLSYHATNPKTGNYDFYPDYQGAASYTIPQDGYINFTYAMTSFFTSNVWSGYDSSKPVSFGVWLVRDGVLTRIYERSGLAGEFANEQITPVTEGDILYYGVVNKGDQLSAHAVIYFYPAKLKKLS